MIRYIFILTIVVTLFSCGSKKKVTNTEIDNNVKERIDGFIEESKKSVYSTIDISKIEGKIIITEIEYDTSTSVDSVTNKPKVKKETITSIDFSKNDSTKTDNTINDNTKSNISKDKEDNSNIKTVIENEKKESSFFYYLYRCAILAGILFVIVFIIGLYDILPHR